MGTGAYILDVIESVAATVVDTQGWGAVPARLQDTVSRRLVGIERQTGPFAVAELRVAEALQRNRTPPPPAGVRLYVADTLDDPFVEQARLGAGLEPIALSRRRANEMKAHEPVVVVLGNPPYRERARGHGGFIESGSPNTDWTTPPLADFREDGNGLAEYVLSNLYVYFWRWATWKVFDAHPDTSEGVICFITTSGYLKGPGFAGMRRYLREHASEGWIIDCTPEGHLPEVATRIFGGVQQPIAIALFVRTADTDKSTPARVRYRAVHGRQAEKFDALKATELDGDEWETCPEAWTAPFLPAGGDDWSSSPSLGDLLPWQSPGVKPNRTWVYAPLPETLEGRWRTLVNAPTDAKAALFRQTRDATLTKKKPGLPGFSHPNIPVAEEAGPCLTPVPIGFRSFDVQYLIPDDRLMETPRPDLWRVRGDHQIYLTELHSEAIRSGPGVTFTAHTPEMHHYKGSGGGRALPLFAGPDRSTPNLAPGLLDTLAALLGHTVEPEDVAAYIGAVTAHPGFTERFAEDLRTPGVRVPLTADPELWDRAVLLGRTVIWLHTRGQRCVDPSQQRPRGNPAITDHRRPKVDQPISTTQDGYPDALTYDPATQTLHVGEGAITPVPAGVVAYDLSGTNLLRKWYGYRKATRPQARGEQSDLDDQRPKTWQSAYTTDLLNLLQVLVLVTELEPQQADLLEAIMSAPRLTITDLAEAGVLPVPPPSRKLPRAAAAAQLALPATAN